MARWKVTLPAGADVGVFHEALVTAFPDLAPIPDLRQPGMRLAVLQVWTEEGSDREVWLNADDTLIRFVVLPGEPEPKVPIVALQALVASYVPIPRPPPPPHPDDVLITALETPTSDLRAALRAWAIAKRGAR